jgi:hypothetical protein
MTAMSLANHGGHKEAMRLLIDHRKTLPVDRIDPIIYNVQRDFIST